MVHLNTAVAVIKDANANAPAICKYLEAIYTYMLKTESDAQLLFERKSHFTNVLQWSPSTQAY